MTSVHINNFFISFLDKIMRELENSKYLSESTNQKIKSYSDFIFNNRNELLSNNEHICNYGCMYYLYMHNHNYFCKCEYCFMTDEEQQKARSFGSREKYTKIPMDYHIHDVVNCILTRDIPLLTIFFVNNFELFKELESLLINL